MSRPLSTKFQEFVVWDSEEHIAGSWIIDVPDLDAATKWAEKCCEACFGPIEVRPFSRQPENV